MMAKMYNFTLPGTPLSKARPRFKRFKGSVCTYDKQSEEKTTARWQLKARMGKEPPLTGPVSLTLLFVLPKPKRWSKKKEIPDHTSKPDLDNLIKWIGDVGNAILWKDDSQIVKIVSEKRYGNEPRTVLTIVEYDE